MTNYTIHLINKQDSRREFWCFLAEPNVDQNIEVFANSNAYVAVDPYVSGLKNSFTIPLQYLVEVGATNQAVGLETIIYSSKSEEANLTQNWNATYSQKPGNIPPDLILDGTTADPETIVMKTNVYDKSLEKDNNWYGNMTFGVKSEQGTMGITWSPYPNTTYSIQPEVKFYVAVGGFSENSLANITTISNNSAVISTNLFDADQQATVTLNADGTWSVKPGVPPSLELPTSHQLLDAHVNLAHAHRVLTKHFLGNLPLNLPAPQKDETRVSTGIKFDKSPSSKKSKEETLLPITGTITVGRAIAAGFAYMVASGIDLNVTYTSANGLAVKFSYHGAAGMEAIRDAFEAGKEILFRRQ